MSAPVYPSPVPPTRRRHRLFTLLALTVSLPLGLAACSGSNTAATTTTAPHFTTLCGAITPADIKTIVGTTVQAPQAKPTTGVDSCIYNAADTSDSVVIDYYTGNYTTADFTSQEAHINTLHPPVVPIEGLANGAYSFMEKGSDGDVNTVVVLLDKGQFLVTGTAAVESLEKLARKVVDQFSEATPPST